MGQILHRSMSAHYPVCLDPQLPTLFTTKLSLSSEGSSIDFGFLCSQSKAINLFSVWCQTIFCKFGLFLWLGATLIPFSVWSDTSSLRIREELAQSRPWWVMSTLPTLVGVPELCLQSFCSLMVSLICEDLKTNGLEMASRCPGLTSGVPTVFWDLCGCFCDTHYTETPPQASKKAAKKDDSFYLVCELWWRESPGTGRWVSNMLCKSRCLSAVFIPSCAYLPIQAGIFSWWQPPSDCLCEGKYHFIWEM